MAGYSADRYWSKEHDQAYSGFPNDDVLNNASSATTVNKPMETYSKSGLNSLYGRLSYDFLSRYLLDFSLRSDESSNLDRVTNAVLSLQFLWPGASIKSLSWNL